MKFISNYVTLIARQMDAHLSLSRNKKLRSRDRVAMALVLLGACAACSPKASSSAAGSNWIAFPAKNGQRLQLTKLRVKSDAAPHSRAELSNKNIQDAIFHQVLYTPEQAMSDALTPRPSKLRDLATVGSATYMVKIVILGNSAGARRIVSVLADGRISYKASLKLPDALNNLTYFGKTTSDDVDIVNNLEKPTKLTLVIPVGRGVFVGGGLLFLCMVKTTPTQPQDAVDECVNYYHYQRLVGGF